jgi:uncharacterized beta-barrel protein YwiB (DUF1934 family)
MINSGWKQNSPNFYEISLIMIKCDDSDYIHFVTRHQNNDVKTTLRIVKMTLLVLSNCCLALIQQFFRYIIARTS